MKNKRVLITGGTGMVGQAFCKIEGYDFIKVGSKDFNLTNSAEALIMIGRHRPDFVIHLAARVGGIKGNIDYIGEFFRDNILINVNLLEACRLYKTPKVISLLSTCIYPDLVNYPLTENQIHEGPPHESNFGYAYAKRMLDIQSRVYRQQFGCDFICAVPNNLFGEYDNFDIENSHVVPAVIRKVYEAKLLNKKEITFWGDGSPLREFTYSKDLPEILLFLLENYKGKTPVNIGNSEEISIHDLVSIITNYFNYEGKIMWDTSMPAGQFKKPSSNKILCSLGFDREYTCIETAIHRTCKWFASTYPKVRGYYQ